MDGLSNLLEYALHSDPTQASAAAGPYGVKEAGQISLVFTKVIAATDLSYSVEKSAGLEQWPLAAPTFEILSDDGVTQTIQAKVATEGAGELFLRLSVSH